MQQLKAFFNRSLYAQVALFMLLYALVHLLCMRVFFQGFLGTFNHWDFSGNETLSSLLTDTPFHSRSITLGSLLNPFFLVALVALYVPFWMRRNNFPPLDRAEHFLLGVCAFVIAWELVTYDYNYYLGSAFWFDRILLLLLSIAIFRFPALIPLFIATAFVYRAQFNYPVAGFPLFDKRLLFDLLVLYLVHQYMRMLFPRFRPGLLYFALIIVASNYFFSGFDKLVAAPHGYEWLTENDSADLFNNVVLRGWLACADANTVDVLRAIIMKAGPVFQVIVLLLEVGVVLIFWKRRLAIFWLCALCVMHFGIFIFGSMLFWKWMVVDLVLVLWLIRRKKMFDEHYKRRGVLVFATCIVCLSAWWLKPISIAWHDTPYTQYFTYEVQDESGNWHAMDKNEMNPYHQWIQYDHFLFLVPDTVLDVSGFGYTADYALANTLRQPAVDYAQLLHEKGEVKLDTTAKREYEEFIRGYFSNRNGRIDRKLFITALAPPHHLYTSVCDENAYTGNFKAAAFRVTLNCEVSAGSRHFPLKRVVADEIVINN